ncbi:HAD hydrolase family protein [Candidatus Woesearchaeota archaeon]|nr:HAD hydrolase family protein [Candidatus Woesearchaeota archaeon]
MAIISGSLNIILEKFIPDCNDIFDDVFLSRIYFDEKGSISKVEATEYDMEGKALAMRKIAERENIRLGECAFVGDYLNDRKIMEEAGLGIAFNCRHDELKKVADVVIEKKDLREILRHII